MPKFQDVSQSRTNAGFRNPEWVLRMRACQEQLCVHSLISKGPVPMRGLIENTCAGEKTLESSAETSHLHRDAVCFTGFLSLWSIPTASFSVFVNLFLILRNYYASLKIKLPGLVFWNEWREKLARLITFHWHCYMLVGLGKEKATRIIRLCSAALRLSIPPSQKRLVIPSRATSVYGLLSTSDTMPSVLTVVRKDYFIPISQIGHQVKARQDMPIWPGRRN